MTEWEYRCVELGRKGTRGELDVDWTYGPWEIGASHADKRPLYAGLRKLGGQGWELAGVLPGDFWAEGTRMPGGSHGVRTVSATLIFKRPASEEQRQSDDQPSQSDAPAPSESL